MTPEEPERLSPLVVRVLAANPGIMTGPGTNTYVVGNNPVVVIDVGPDDATHMEAVDAGVAGRDVAAVLCSHHHVDHAPGTVPFAKAHSAPVLAMVHPEGPVLDRALSDGDEVRCGEVTLTALFTPGHASDHLCFWLESEPALFSGDHIMSGSTVVIAPPDGHMATYLDSLRRVAALPPGRIYPGHGPVIDDGRAVINEYIVHREARKEQVAARLAAGDSTINEMVASIYAGVAEALYPIARHSVQAHLHQLHDENRASVVGDPMDLAAHWSL